jgi:LmbE family N-acetylglucosaminyl deacetylase
MAKDLDMPNFSPLKPKVVLGVAAHPDDLEFGIAGSIASWVKAGAEAYYLILTNGNKGSADRTKTPAELHRTRRAEQEAAAKILGVKKVFFCEYEDGLLQAVPEVKRDIVRVIRTVRPDVVLCMDPSFLYSASRGFINHPDHRAAGQATLDAVYPLARDHLSFPELLQKEKLEPHKVGTVLLTNLEDSNFFVDITGSIDTKLKTLAAHASQIPDMVRTTDFVRQMAERQGNKIGARYAEGFLRIDVN